MGDKSDYEVVALFESPIDALSYYELFGPTKMLLVSLCGTPSKSQREGLVAKIRHFGLKKVRLCFDADEAGDAQACDLRKSLPLHFEVSRLRPLKKDWNDVLNKKRNV